MTTVPNGSQRVLPLFGACPGFRHIPFDLYSHHDAPLQREEDDEMPTVKGKQYPYTKTGKAAAVAARKPVRVKGGVKGGKKKM